MVRFTEVQEKIDFSTKAIQRGNVKGAVNTLMKAFQQVGSLDLRAFRILATDMWNLADDISSRFAKGTPEEPIVNTIRTGIEQLAERRGAEISFPTRDKF